MSFQYNLTKVAMSQFVDNVVGIKIHKSHRLGIVTQNVVVRCPKTNRKMFEFMDDVCVWEIIGRICVGVILLKLLYSLFRGLNAAFIAERLGLNADLPTYGKWAVVTGPTDGIGKSFALELAKRGMNIVLISRSPFKLQNVAAEIKEKYNRETMIIDVDFTSHDIYERIESEIQNLEIGVLVNNVGMSVPHPDHIEKFDEKFLKDVIMCNVTSVTMMTRIVMSGMKERKKGMIINISSLSSLIPAPLMTIYAATKAFVTSFSHSMSAELMYTGVQVQCLYPSFISTKLSKIKRTSIFVPSSDDYVKSALACCGVESMSAGYYIHNAQVYVIDSIKKYLPVAILDVITYKFISGIRKKYLKKIAEKEK